MSSHARGLRTAALCGLLLSGGCNQALTGAREESASQPPPPSQPPPLAIVPGVIELVVGQSLQLARSGGAASDLLWASSDLAVASITAGGLVTADGVGTATIMLGESSACLASSARPAPARSGPGSYAACAYATISVFEKFEPRRKY